MTTSFNAVGVLASAAASLVESYEVVDVVTRMLGDAVALGGATSGGVILRRPGQRHLNVLAATSHEVQELELYQAQVEQGPCFDAVQTGGPVEASGEEITGRWPQVGHGFEHAGLVRAHATPLIWQTVVIGALNVFWSEEANAASDRAPGLDDVLRTFANMMTLAIIHAAPLPPEVVTRRIRGALSERTLLEQVKGVLAHQRGISPEQAHGVLLAIARSESETVRTTAARLLRAAEHGTD